MRRKMCIYKCMLNVYKNQQNRQTGGRNLMGPKILPMIWGTYMKLVTKYKISVINSGWEKCDEKWAYMFNVYKNQQSRQAGSRHLTDPKTLPTIWYTYMTLVTKYQISAIESYWEKCEEKYKENIRKNINTKRPRDFQTATVRNLLTRQQSSKHYY
jgi:S-adenosylmethionine:diacylglycerol 3-amino-3-carboxypropyl transferase